MAGDVDTLALRPSTPYFLPFSGAASAPISIQSFSGTSVSFPLIVGPELVRLYLHRDVILSVLRVCAPLPPASGSKTA